MKTFNVKFTQKEHVDAMVALGRATFETREALNKSVAPEFIEFYTKQLAAYEAVASALWKFETEGVDDE